MVNPIIKQIKAFASQRNAAYQRVKALNGKRTQAIAEIKKLCDYYSNLPVLTPYLKDKLRSLCAQIMPPAHSRHHYWNDKINNLLQP